MLVHEKTENLFLNMGYLPMWESMWYERDGIEDTLCEIWKNIENFWSIKKCQKMSGNCLWKKSDFLKPVPKYFDDF